MDLQIFPLDPAHTRQAPTSNFGFGNTFSNRMFTQRYSDGLGWDDARIEPYGPLTLDPATAALHYAQMIFEGLKAYRRPDGHVNLFRPSGEYASLQ